MAKVPEHLVFMENITSQENYWYPDNHYRPVLNEISLLIRRAEVWGVTGSSLYEIKLLLEIMANIRPYAEGRCVLAERGMIRHKRTILDHVFYIGSSDMIYNNMNVLEYLMFCLAKSKKNKVELQEEVFEFLIAIGLGKISLTPNYFLTDAEKAVIALVAAVYSDCMLIVFNLPEYSYDEMLIEAIAGISRLAREKSKTIVLGTENKLLIEKSCSHTVILKDGKVLYEGKVDDFRLHYDQVLIIIRDDQLEILLEKLKLLLPEYKLTLQENCLLISAPGLEDKDPGTVYKRMIEVGIYPQYLEINPKTVQNAYEELVNRDDIYR